MTIVPYQPAYRSAFVALNTQWIQTLFGQLEPEDRATFDHLEAHLQAGAMAFFAVENGRVLATCLTLPREAGTWELCKLATDPQAQAGGWQRRLCQGYGLCHRPGCPATLPPVQPEVGPCPASL